MIASVAHYDSQPPGSRHCVAKQVLHTMIANQVVHTIKSFTIQVFLFGPPERVFVCVCVCVCVLFLHG